MNGGSKIVGLKGRGSSDATSVGELPGPLDMTEDFDEPIEPAWGRAAAGLALALAAAWIAAMIWLGRPQLASGNALNVASFAALVSMPLALGGVIWLLTMRTSRAEARRFGTTARAMRIEAARLERVIATMSRRLDDSRQALAEQTEQMLALGENAATRIAAAGIGIGQQAAGIEASAARIDSAAAAADAQLNPLLERLPDAHARTDAIAAALTGAGSAAAEQVATLDQRLDAVIDRSQAARQFADDALQLLADRLTAIANEGDRATETMGQAQQAAERVTAELGEADVRLTALHRVGVERADQLTASITGLGGAADGMTQALQNGDAAAQDVIARAEAGLTAMDAVVRELDETLPAALARLDARVGESRTLAATAHPELQALVTAAEASRDATAAVVGLAGEQRLALEAIAGTIAMTLAESQERTVAVGTAIDDAVARAQGFAREAAPQLVEALMRMRDTANTAAERAREALAVVIPEAAASLETATTAAFRRASAVSLDRQVAALTQAAGLAIEAGQRASDRLTRQLVTIADTTAAVEARIDDARAERAEADEGALARRSAALLEALNSAAIDISDALASDTSDAAWANYLKGDRGAFTRRAVRLLAGGAAHDIAALYESDRGFREQVNRYVHDFEGMLRGVLATSEGGPLAVTLVSSDLGKLYVALAQSIERLR